MANTIKQVLFAAFILILFAACSSGNGTEVKEEEVKQPNILLIIADDLGYADVSAAPYSASDVKTPNIDRIADMGAYFTQAYASSPICNASRAGLITGSYQERFGTYWYGGKGIHDDRFTTLAEALKENGYQTGYIGKFHYGSNHLPDNRNFPLQHGFDYFYGFSGGRKHYLNHQTALEEAFLAVKKEHKRKGQSLQQGPVWNGSEKEDVQGFSTEFLGEKTREYMQQHKENPFFLTVGFNAVHNFTHQLPQEYLDKHNLKGYHDWDPATEDYYEWYKQGRLPNNPEGRAHFLGQLHYLDLEIGKILDELKRLKLEENTLIIFIGDNGGSTPIYANNGPLRGSKYTLYEGGVRVPLIIAWPKQWQKGKTISNVISSMDIFPTLCDRLDITPPSHLDGMNIQSLLSGKDTSLEHETLVWDTKHETAVRHGKWKLKTANNNDHAHYEMVEVELGTFLFDLEADPGEQNNLAEEYPEIVKELQEIHQAWENRIAEGFDGRAL